VEDYFHTDDKHSRLIDYGMVKNKVAVLVGTFDDVCHIHHTEWFVTQVADYISYFKAFLTFGHTLIGLDQSDYYVGEMIKALDYQD
jgi:hypothetical protein